MKEETIVNKTSVEKSSLQSVFVSFDGERFDCKEECAEYEKAMKVILRVQVKKIAIVVTDASDLFCGEGSEDHEALVVVPKTKADIELLRKLLQAHDTEPARVDKQVSEKNIGEPLVVTFDYEWEWAYIDSLKKMIETNTKGQFTVVPASK